MVTSSIDPRGIRPVVHIGMPKSASTSLQSHLFSKHSQIEYLGSYKYVVDPNRPGHKTQWKKWSSEAMHQLQMEMAERRRPQHANLDECRKLYGQRIAASFREGRVPLWSWESMMLNRRGVREARARNIRAVLGDCRIVAVIRHPLKLVESAYFQFLKQNNLGTGHHYRRPVYVPMDKWIERFMKGVRGEPDSHLDYAQSIRAFVDVFGKDQVQVLCMEDLAKNTDAFLRELCGHIGVDAAEGIELAASKRENSRWTVEQIDRLKELSKCSFMEGMRFRFLRPKQRRKLLGLPDDRLAPVRGGEPARAPIPEPHAGRIQDITREGHQWLAKTFKLPLEKYGYPI